MYFHVSDGLSLYQNARFRPINDDFILENITPVYSQMECAYYYARNTMYSGLRDDYTLVLARVDQGALNMMVTSSMTSALSSENKTLLGKRLVLGPMADCR